jgi:NAD+ diphosphatase
LTFTGMPLDRASAARADAAWVADRLEDPVSRVVAANSDGVLLDGGVPQQLLRLPVPDEIDLRAKPELLLLLGLERGAALFGVDLDGLGPRLRERLIERGRIAALRAAGAVLSHGEGGLAAYLVALLGWHRRHRFCANCGALTVVAEAGGSRRCPRCGALHFPRTDPAVIVLVEHDGRVLLGRHAAWPPRQYSVLAGFVAPGESLEEAVVREVEEESGIRVHDPRFVTSQPWPFPSSLMLGFVARANGGHPVNRDGELEDVRWFTRAAVGQALSDGGGELLLPPSVSIARFLMERWWRGESS